MLWVLQDNLYNESAFEGLLNQLDAQGVSYQVVSVDGKTNTLTPEISYGGKIFVCGGKSLEKIAVLRNWRPGYIGENLDYEMCLAKYGEHMLNAEAVVLPVQEHTKRWDKFFVRPVFDSKQFDGMTTDWDNFEYWRNQVRIKAEKLGGDAKLSMKDKIVMAPLRKILAEYRFFVVDGKVVTGSIYKLGSVVLYSDRIDEAVWSFARERVAQWSPSKAFVLDIAETSEGFKVLELNAINSAGFYACDMGKFIDAINSLYGAVDVH